MSKCGQEFPAGGLRCVHTYIYIHRHTHIYIYIVLLMILRLFINAGKYSVFEHHTHLCLPPRKGSRPPKAIEGLSIIT